MMPRNTSTLFSDYEEHFHNTSAREYTEKWDSFYNIAIIYDF